MTDTTFITRPDGELVPTSGPKAADKSAAHHYPALAGCALPGFPATSTVSLTLQEKLSAFAAQHGGKVEIVTEDLQTRDATMQEFDQKFDTRKDQTQSVFVTFLNDAVALKVASANGIQYSAKNAAVEPSLSGFLESSLSMNAWVNISDIPKSPEELFRFSTIAIRGISSAIDAWKKLGAGKLEPSDHDYSRLTGKPNVITKFLMAFDMTVLYKCPASAAIYTTTQPENGEVVFSIKPELSRRQRIVNRLRRVSEPELSMTVNSATDKDVKIHLAINGKALCPSETFSHKDAAIFTRAFIMALSQINDHARLPQERSSTGLSLGFGGLIKRLRGAKQTELKQKLLNSGQNSTD